MAVPKSKVSKQRKHTRRAANYTLDAPNITACPQCKKMKTPHHVCKFCGYYDGRKAIDLGEKKAAR